MTPSGSGIAPAVNCVPMSAPSTDTVSCSGIDCTSASISMVLAVLGDQGAGRGLALDDDVDLDGHLLAAADDEQVGVLDVAADRVDVERLGQRELLLAVDVEGQHGVGAGVAQHGGEVVGGQQQVLRVGAVAVEHGGHLAVAAGAARCALAGLGAHGGGQVVRLRAAVLAMWCCSCMPVVGLGTARVATTQMRVPVDNGGQMPPSP